jgi:hypothetical protein
MLNKDPTADPRAGFLRELTSRNWPRFQRAAPWIAAAGLLALGLVVWIAGATVMSGRPWDVPIVLDGAWRVFQGQTPHVDFFSHIGAFPFYLYAAAFSWGGASVSAIPAGQALLLWGATPFAIWLLHRRFRGEILLPASLFFGLLLVSPRPLGDPYMLNDYAMLYNRIGEAVLFLLSILLWVPAPGLGRRTAFFESVAAGSCLFSLAFIKLNYAVIGFASLALAALLRARTLREVAAMIAAAVALAAMALASTGISPAAMAVDFRIMSRAQDPAGKLMTLGVQALKQAPYLLPLLVAAVAAGRRSAGLKRFRTAAIAIALCAFSLLLLASNSQRNDMPLLAAAALAVAAGLRSPADAAARGSLAPVHVGWGTALILVLYLGPILGADAAALRNSLFNDMQHPDRNPHFAGTALEDFVFEKDGLCGASIASYEEGVADGLALIARSRVDLSEVHVAAFSNPFHFGLRRAPPRGGAVCFADNAFNRTSHPSWDRVIGDAKYLLCRRGSIDEILAIFSLRAMDMNVEQIAASPYYELFAVREENRE